MREIITTFKAVTERFDPPRLYPNAANFSCLLNKPLHIPLFFSLLFYLGSFKRVNFDQSLKRIASRKTSRAQPTFLDVLTLIFGDLRQILLSSDSVPVQSVIIGQAKHGLMRVSLAFAGDLISKHPCFRSFWRIPISVTLPSSHKIRFICCNLCSSIKVVLVDKLEFCSLNTHQLLVG